MTVSPKIAIQGAQGNPLPRDWRQQAEQRGKQAQQAYLNHLENAWKPEERAFSGSLARDARLASWKDILGEK